MHCRKGWKSMVFSTALVAAAASGSSKAGSTASVQTVLLVPAILLHISCVCMQHRPWQGCSKKWSVQSIVCVHSMSCAVQLQPQADGACEVE
jgi:hypothetical protein